MIESVLMKGGKSYGSVLMGPGPSEVLGQIEDDLYFGPVSTGEGLPSGSQISTLSGVSQGNLMFDTNLTWLKYALGEKVLFVARNNVRSSVSWKTLNDNGLVYGTKEIVFEGNRFIVRLLKGGETDPSTATTNYYNDKPDSTEWGRTLRRVANISLYGTEEWKNYLAAELNFHGGVGGASWCQETFLGRTEAMIRGLPGNDVIYREKTDTMYRNWRPVLEWIG